MIITREHVRPLWFDIDMVINFGSIKW
jgi:hypothetical protein